MKKAPVIILGMHRSGTTMITRLLEDLGLFMGYEKEVNSESIFFHKLNRWIMTQANAAWDNPMPARFKNDFHNNNVIRVVEKNLKNFRRYKYLGPNKYFKYKDLRNLDFPWGWKDPVNTLNIDIWKAIFPEARVLHIYRNPIDIAESLRVREHKVQGRFRLNFAKRMHEQLLTSRRLYNRSVRLFDINEGIKLWEEYMAAAQEASMKYKDSWLDVKYEAFLDEPEAHLKKIISYIGLHAEEAKIKALTNVIKNDRKFAFTQDDRLMALYHAFKNKDIMIKLGYHHLD